MILFGKFWQPVLPPQTSLGLYSTQVLGNWCEVLWMPLPCLYSSSSLIPMIPPHFHRSRGAQNKLIQPKQDFSSFSLKKLTKRKEVFSAHKVFDKELHAAHQHEFTSRRKRTPNSTQLHKGCRVQKLMLPQNYTVN